MIPLKLTFGDGNWPDLIELLKEGKLLGIDGAKFQKAKMSLNVLDNGMTSGRPSVGVRIDLEGGPTVITEISARLFCTAARGIMAKYPGLFDEH